MLFWTGQRARDHEPSGTDLASGSRSAVHGEDGARSPVGDGAFEVVAVADGPVGHVAAVAAAHDRHLTGVDVVLTLHPSGDGLDVDPILIAP